MDLIFLAFEVGAAPTECEEIHSDDIEYAEECAIGGGMAVKLHTKDGRKWWPLLNVDDDFNEIDGEEKRAFLRSKLRSI